MRSRTFEVPVDLMVDFAQIIDQYELDNVIEGVTEDNDIEVRVDFQPNQRNVISKIVDLIDEFKENNYDEDNDDQDDDDNEDDKDKEGWW